MVEESSIIETGVDKLVEIVRSKKKISIPDAAKSLGVGANLVEEWADFLEEEGIISIEYKLATPYLIERKLSKQEIKTKEKDFHSKKEGFVRKAEVTLALLDREDEDFLKFKNKFEQLKKDLGSELNYVQSELKQLERFENLKNNIDKQILEQENDFRQKMSQFESEISREQHKYKDILDGIKLEEEALDKEKLETLSLREKEISINKKLEEFQANIFAIHDAIKKDKDIIDDSKKRIKELKDKANLIKKEIEQKRAAGDSLLSESNNHKKKILEIQKQILEKAEKNKSKITKQIEDGKTHTRKFQEFFNKKTQIEKLMQKIEEDKTEMEKELIALIKKAKAYHISSQSDALKGPTKELEKSFENIKNKKAEFEREAGELSSLLKS